MVITYILNRGFDLIGKKWRAVVIWHLQYGPLRFSELKRTIPEISVKVLSEVLQDLEQHDLVIRTQYASIPVKVTYELHPDAKMFTGLNSAFVKLMGEYLIKNSKKLKIPHDVVAEINTFLVEQKDQSP